MDNIKQALENWMNELSNFSFKEYEALPEIDLYMDQVVTFLDKQLSIFQTSTLDKHLFLFDNPDHTNTSVKNSMSLSYALPKSPVFIITSFSV